MTDLQTDSSYDVQATRTLEDLKREVGQCLDRHLEVWTQTYAVNEEGFMVPPLRGFTQEKYEFYCNECPRKCKAMIVNQQTSYRFTATEEERQLCES